MLMLPHAWRAAVCSTCAAAEGRCCGRAGLSLSTTTSASASLYPRFCVPITPVGHDASSRARRSAARAAAYRLMSSAQSSGCLGFQFEVNMSVVANAGRARHDIHLTTNVRECSIGRSCNLCGCEPLDGVRGAAEALRAGRHDGLPLHASLRSLQ